MSLRNRLHKLEQSAHECPTCGRALNASDRASAEDIAWAKERMAFYRSEGMTDAWIQQQIPEIVELANLSAC